MSSSRPMNGLTYFAPAFAARIAWFAEKMSVVLIFTPSEERALIALRPSVDRWLGPDMSISASRETSFPPGRDKLLIRTARAGGPHGCADSLASSRFPPVVGRTIRVPNRRPIHRPCGPLYGGLHPGSPSCGNGASRGRGHLPLPDLRPARGRLGGSPAAQVDPHLLRPGPRDPDRGNRVPWNRGRSSASLPVRLLVLHWRVDRLLRCSLS